MGAPVAYFEIISADPARAQEFYATLFDWTLAEGGSPDYRLVDTGAGDDAIGGGIGPSLPDSPAGTKVYVRFGNNGLVIPIEQLSPEEIGGVPTAWVFLSR